MMLPKLAKHWYQQNEDVIAALDKSTYDDFKSSNQIYINTA